MSLTHDIPKLEESVRVYSEVIESFERARERLLTRRRGAIDSVMAQLDESLALNQRTLDSLRNVLGAAKSQLAAERSRQT